MATYLVTYDLNREVNRPPIVAAIKKFENWAKLSESSYAINVGMTVYQVFDLLKPLIDENDNLYVITLSSPFTGWGPGDVNDWLNQYL